MTETKKKKALVKENKAVVIKKAEILDVEKLESDVINMVKFDVLKSDLEKEVKESSVVVYDTTKEETIGEAKKAKKELRSKEIIVEKNGLSFRRIFNNINTYISTKEKELTGITSPEVERLGKVVTDTEDFLLKQEREEKLPARKERLVSIGDKIEVEDETLLGMDSAQFETYYNQRVADKNEADRIALENKAKEEADLKAKQDQERADLLAKQQKELDDEKARLIQEKADFEAEQQIRLNTPLATQTPPANTGAQVPIDAKRIAYVNFLKDNGYSKETKQDFIQKKNETSGNWELFKKVAIFNQ